MTKLLSFDSEGVQFAWDATSVSSFEKCPRYYQYSHMMGWQRNTKSVHLIFGGHFATALEHYYKYTFTGHTPDEALEKVILETLIATWEFDFDEETSERVDDSGEPWDSLHNTKTRGTLIRSIVWYFAHFDPDPTETVKLSDGTPAVELSFSLPFESEDLLYCGHLDRFVVFGDKYYIMDQKTTGTTVTNRFFEQFTPDIQMSGYAWAGEILFDLPNSGVIIDAAQIAVGFTKFTRSFIHRAEYHLNEWYDNTLATIEDAQRATRDNEFRMNRQSCGNYGGCQYRPICSRSPQHRPNIFEADFHRAPRWDPLEKR